ncbi:MAG: hypothetical protein WC046_09345 [Candidatus Bathyarchaeia archaeon]
MINPYKNENSLGNLLLKTYCYLKKNNYRKEIEGQRLHRLKTDTASIFYDTTQKTHKKYDADTPVTGVAFDVAVLFTIKHPSHHKHPRFHSPYRLVWVDLKNLTYQHHTTTLKPQNQPRTKAFKITLRRE